MTSIQNRFVLVPALSALFLGVMTVFTGVTCAATTTTATVTVQDKYFNGNNKAPTEVIFSGIAPGDVVFGTSTSSIFDGSTVQENRLVTVSGIYLFGPDAAKYELANTVATTTGAIVAWPLQIVPDNVSKFYGDSDPEITFRSCCLVSGDSFVGSLTRKPGENMGAYAIDDFSGLDTVFGKSNYSFYFLVGSPRYLTITGPRPITITADSASKTSGQPDAMLTYKITSGSLVLGDTLAGALTRQSGESAGTYAIDIGSLTIVNQNNPLAASNYAVTFVPATYTILPALTNEPKNKGRHNGPRCQKWNSERVLQMRENECCDEYNHGRKRTCQQ